MLHTHIYMYTFMYLMLSIYRNFWIKHNLKESPVKKNKTKKKDI